MTGTPLHLALREMKAMYASRPALTTMAVLGLIAGLVGPFGTFNALSLPLSVLYWVLIAFVTGGTGVFGATLATALLVGSGGAPILRAIVMALGAAVPVTLSVIAISAVFFDPRPFLGPDAGILLVQCFAVALAVFVMLELVIDPLMARSGSGARPAPPAILKRLPPALRGPLTHMSMADHYVEVHTTRGNAMVLMRFSDALKETEGTEGVRIHRSHWVARDAIAGLDRIRGKPTVRLSNGVQLPVSRSYLAAVKKAVGA